MTVTVNESLARAYVRAMLQLERLGAEEGNRTILSDYKTADLARFPDVLTVEKKEEDQDQVKALLLAALDRALDDFNTMRAREGEKLKADILGRADTIESLTAKVEQRSPETVKEYRNRLEVKMQEVLQNTQIDESRLLTEAAIFADKVAVDEETVRLHSHLSQLRELLGKGGAVGRKLDFLIQEFNREANTIGSKCSDIRDRPHRGGHQGRDREDPGAGAEHRIRGLLREADQHWIRKYDLRPAAGGHRQPGLRPRQAHDPGGPGARAS